MRADGRNSELTNNGAGSPVESGPFIEPWGNNMTEREFYSKLPVYDMFPLSDWQVSSKLLPISILKFGDFHPKSGEKILKFGDRDGANFDFLQNNVPLSWYALVRLILVNS